MAVLILGLVLFLGMHSARIIAAEARARFIEQRGEIAWKALYSVVSLLGFVLLIWGYAQARDAGVWLWHPPVAMRHVAALLTLLAFVLLAAAYVPGNHLKARLGHPMILAVKTWAVAHLLANGSLHAIILFGAFLAWAVVDFIACRKRDRLAAPGHGIAATVMAPSTVHTLITVGVGVAAWVVFALWLHVRWIGVAPFG